MGGCGLFDTRDAPPPSAPAAHCAIYTEPESLVYNIRAHYGRSSVGGCYNPMLDPLFSFTPDPVDLSTSPAQFANWDRLVEEQVAIAIATDSVVSFQVFFDGYYQSPIVDTGTPQKETRFYNYHLLFRRVGQFAPTRYQGRMDITFQQETASFWRVLSWSDHSDGSGFPTWGRLRADHRAGG